MAYDSKAIKLHKEVKRVAATILNRQDRRAFIHEYVLIKEQEASTRAMRNRADAKETKGE